MWLERLIIRKAQRKLLPYRQRATELDADLMRQYRDRLPEIECLYAETTYWHGTGRYQYCRLSKDVDDKKVIDVLGAVLAQRQLEPRRDPWIDSGGDTVSLATVRMHGRIYAVVHQNQATNLAYELGSATFWSRFYFTLLFVWLNTNLWRHRTFIKKLLRPASFSQIQNRVGTTRKPRNQKSYSFVEFLQGKHLSSDIEGNYAVLFGVRPQEENLIEAIPLTHKVEQRSLQPITLDQITHIEVPLDYVSVTEQKLRQYNADLPVLPLEFGDLYLVDRPLRELAFS